MTEFGEPPDHYLLPDLKRISLNQLLFNVREKRRGSQKCNQMVFLSANLSILDVHMKVKMNCSSCALEIGSPLLKKNFKKKMHKDIFYQQLFKTCQNTAAIRSIVKNAESLQEVPDTFYCTLSLQESNQDKDTATSERELLNVHYPAFTKFEIVNGVTWQKSLFSNLQLLSYRRIDTSLSLFQQKMLK